MLDECHDSVLHIENNILAERPLFVLHAFNCNVHTIQRIQERYNATNSTNDLSRSGRPRAKTPRHDSYILRQHMNNQLTRPTQTA